MAEINQYGYQKIREFVIANWKYIELQDVTGTAVKRFTNEVVIIGNPNSPELTFTVVAEGEEYTGKTVSRVALFDVETGGTAIGIESFTSFTFGDVADQLTVNFKLQVPQVI